MMFCELERFCTDHGLRCRITMGAGSGSLEDAIRTAMSDYLERQSLVDLPMLRGATQHQGRSKTLHDETLIELEEQSYD